MKILKGVSEKINGNMKVYAGTSGELANLNRSNYLKKAGLKSEDLILTGLVHGNKVAVVGEKEKGMIIPQHDALITNAPGVILGTTGADCLPIFFWNKQKTIIGIAHAGWHGVERKTVEEVIKVLVGKYDCLMEDIVVEIGPHILDCHFEVQMDVVNVFSAYPKCLKKVGGKNYFSLQCIVKEQLVVLGLNSENIIMTKECTYCNADKYFSYRRDKPEEIEAMLAYIVLQ